MSLDLPSTQSPSYHSLFVFWILANWWGWRWGTVFTSESDHPLIFSCLEPCADPECFPHGSLCGQPLGPSVFENVLVMPSHLDDSWLDVKFRVQSSVLNCYSSPVALQSSWLSESVVLSESCSFVRFSALWGLLGVSLSLIVWNFTRTCCSMDFFLLLFVILWAFSFFLFWQEWDFNQFEVGFITPRDKGLLTNTITNGHLMGMRRYPVHIILVFLCIRHA